MTSGDPYEVQDVAFDAEGVTLRGWLYRPKATTGPAPVVVMAHGYNCIKELYLDRYAAALASAGHVVLAYDHRNFGDSDGEPRQELDPWLQVRDYRNAITYTQTLDGVDPDRVGIWGTSLAGGHVLVVGAIDRRVGCVVAQVPTISGWQSTLRRTPPPALPGQRKAWEADRLERYRGGEPKMVPMVVDPDQGGPASHASADAWEFFTGKHAPADEQVALREVAQRDHAALARALLRVRAGLLHRAHRADAAAGGDGRQRRRLPHRPGAGGVRAGERAQAARALPRRALLRLHGPVRPRGGGRHRVVHRAPPAGG